MPDLVFGWELGPDRRKPNPYPVLETIRRLGLEPRDVLVVDDLRPGVDMAKAAGVDAAAAGWAHDISSIREFMRQSCVAYFATVADSPSSSCADGGAASYFGSPGEKKGGCSSASPMSCAPK